MAEYFIHQELMAKEVALKDTVAEDAVAAGDAVAVEVAVVSNN